MSLIPTNLFRIFISENVFMEFTTLATKCWLYEFSVINLKIIDQNLNEIIFETELMADSFFQTTIDKFEQANLFKLQIDPLINNNLPILYAISKHDPSNPLLKTVGDGFLKHWVGEKNIFLYGNKRIAWLYNDEDNICLEVAPILMCEHDDPDDDGHKSYAACEVYQNFIKNDQFCNKYFISGGVLKDLIQELKKYRGLMERNEIRSLRNRPAISPDECFKYATPCSIKKNVPEKLITIEYGPAYPLFVIFYRCINGDYHSFARRFWSQLDAYEQMMFINYGYTDVSGNILQ